jgi:ligand-binding SRPBCC domain-containing protein
MPQINLITSINAPVKRVFDLSRSIDLHTASTAKSQEQAIAGVTSGLIQHKQTVTWRAKHFGCWLTMTSKIIKMESPKSFSDEMTKGPFKSLLHHHYFDEVGNQTIMRDEFNFSSPYGILGKLTDDFILSTYLKNLLQTRNKIIKECAEGEGWKDFLNY